MTKEKDIKRVVPALRFPEFRDAEGWRIKPFGIIADIIKGKQLNAIELKSTGKYPCLNGGIQPSGFTNDYNTAENTITISEGGNSCGYVNFVETKFWCGGHCYVVSIKDKPINKIFFYQYLKGDESKIMALRVGSGLPNIQKKSILEYDVSIPNTNAEQIKIANCLGSLDDLISAVTEKIEALKEYKKGLMQQLFPAEGKTTPALRFPEFKKAGEWEETTLGGICDMQAGKFVSASEIYKVKKEAMYPCYGGNGLRGYTHSFTHFGIYPLIGRQGAQCGNITYAEGKFHATEHAVVVSLKKDIDIRWLYYLLIKLNLNQYATGQAQPGLSVDIIKKVAIRIPENKNEQQQIACSILSIDDLISVEIQKLDQLKAHKKGLMQQLFPNLQ